MSQFLAAAPADFLEPLLSSPFGRVYKLFLERCCIRAFEHPDAVNVRENLSQQLRQTGFQSNQGHGLLLALMPFFPPNNLKVEDAAAKLPAWLLELYRGRYEAPTGQQPSAAPAPTGQPSFTDRIFLNRMLGLSNLYYIDPEDQEILQELRQLRLQLSQLILNCPEQQLESLFGADLADRYWALVRSGVQKEPLQPAEDQLKGAVTTKLSPNSGGGFGTPGAVNAFLVAMAFYEPGSMQVEGAEHKLPGWLLAGYREVFAQALPA